MSSYDHMTHMVLSTKYVPQNPLVKHFFCNTAPVVGEYLIFRHADLSNIQYQVG